MKKSYLERYIGITLRHVDTLNLAALYAESLINDYSEEYACLISDAIVSRPDGIETLVSLTVDLYKQGLFEAVVPLEIQAMKNMIDRGDPREAIKHLAEMNNLKNAIRIVAANCDWLPEQEINDDLLDTVTNQLLAIATQKKAT